ncbi:MAG: DUF7619 domain-containing protein [Arcticibacter sp.]
MCKIQRSKFLLVLSMFICWIFINPSYGQNLIWDKTIGGNFIETFSAVEQTQDGGFIIAGSSSSDVSGDKSEPNSGGDYWLVKLNAAGQIEWENTIGGSASDNLNCIQPTSDGGFILGGGSSSPISGDKTEASINGSPDFWLVKLDATGNIQWQNTIGGNFIDIMTSVQQTIDGGFILAGYSNSNISADKSQNCRGGYDYWIVKTDDLGNVQWDKTYGGNQFDELFSVRQSTDGGFILGGYSESPLSGDKTEGVSGLNDYWILKLDGNGNLQWQNTLQGTDVDQLYFVEPTADGGFVCAGFSDSGLSSDKIENTLGAKDYWILKLDAFGQILWQNVIGGQSNDYLYSIENTMDGGFICAGHSNSPISGDKSENGSGDDYWLVKLDSLGHLEWEQTIGGSSSDKARWAIQTSDGDFVIGGVSISPVSGDKTEPCIGFDDYWIAKIDGGFNQIRGVVFADLNANGIRDINEPTLSNIKVEELNSSAFGLSNMDGSYVVTVLDTGVYNVRTSLIPNYYISSPLAHSASFMQMLSVDSLNDFAIQPSGVFDDLSVSLAATTNFRSGMNGTYVLNCKNIGTTSISPTIVFHFDSQLTFNSSVPAPSQIFADSLVFSLPTLDPFQSSSVQITMQIDLGLPNGTLITSTANANSLITDANPSNNNCSWTIPITGSYDPNDIQVSRDTIFDSELSSPPFLEYIIRFQNTGNDTAFYVRVDNSYSEDLDPSSFELIASSHNVIMDHSTANLFHFIFNNIQLPDSGTNLSASQGYIKYRIKPDTNCLPGDVITSSANIFFDYNPPIATNTAITEVVTVTDVLDWNNIHWVLYPNPVNDFIHLIHEGGDFPQVLSITNLHGQIVFQKTLNASHGQHRISCDVSTWSKGLYHLRIGEDSIKFLKQ